jgi:molybdenum cofactor cytidylyltransferase
MAVDVCPVMVLGPHNAHLPNALDLPSNLTIAMNPDPSQGKVQSILQGLAHLPDQWEAVFISAVDQPRSRIVYQRLLHAFRQHRAPITRPSHGDRHGHPVLFSRQVLPQLKAISEETSGLRHLVNTYHQWIDDVPINSAEVLLDLNTPEHYTRARNQVDG